MKKRYRMLGMIFAVVFCALFAAGCGNGDNPEEASPTPEPIQTTATDAVVLPEPAPAVSAAVPEASMTPLVPVEGDAAADGGAADGVDGGSESSDDGGSESSDDSSGPLKLEMENDRVTALQERLNELGYLDTVTGYFGTDTEAAVKEFQENNGLDADGIVGSGTQEVLDSDDAKEAS